MNARDPEATRRIELEVKLSFLEETLDALNEVVLAQGTLIERLQSKLERVEARLEKGGGEVGPQDERPPHY